MCRQRAATPPPRLRNVEQQSFRQACSCIPAMPCRGQQSLPLDSCPEAQCLPYTGPVIQQIGTFQGQPLKSRRNSDLLFNIFPVSERTDGIARRRCTDPCCGLAFVFSMVAIATSLRVVQSRDLQRLTRGIDHRGRICGWSAGTEELGLLHWCTARTEHGWILNLSSPICVGRCPDIGEHALCPEGPQATEVEEPQEGGRVLIVRTEKQFLSPREVTVETNPWVDRYCVPTRALSDALTSGATLAGSVGPGAPMDWFMGCFERLQNLASSPRLLCLAGLWALLVSLVYLLCLRFFALLLLRLALLGSGLLFFAAGIVLLVLTHPDAVPGLLPLVVTSVSLATGGLVELNVAHTLALSEVPILVATLASGLLLGALLLFTSCVAARTRLEVAADCVRESCAVMMGMPSLLLLPVVDALACQTMWILLLTGLPALLSGADVSGITLFGISGVFRQLHLAFTDYLHIAALVFSCFWAQELVAAACLFATAHSVAAWYFAPGSNVWQKARHLPVAPAVQGLLVALTCHLGSIARGAFAVALLRFLRWALWSLHLAVARQEDDKGKRKSRGCCACIAVACDSLMATLQAWTEFLSSHAYVDIALSSTSYAMAASKASKLLRSDAGLVTMLSIVAWFLRLMGSLGLAAAAALAARTAVARHADWYHLLSELRFQLQVSDFPYAAAQLSLLYEEVQAVSPELLGILTAIATMLVSRALLFNVECAACTVLYCLIWDGSDGVMDASHLPESFWKFARDRGIASKRPKTSAKGSGPRRLPEVDVRR
ncbi:SLC44A1 [Symbiodinium natans]|uniref:Choline transporter-like protein n=1 Tax=Symbiodinium natans TaxID=878477 RepID=A0A812TWS6_9DINO|nr:SLC44A1 [Symbiodinium natans]